MSLGALGEYAESLFASSPCIHKSFPRILRICLNTFRAYGDDFVYGTANNPNLQYFPSTLKYFLRILRICLDTFHAVSVGA